MKNLLLKSLILLLLFSTCHADDLMVVANPSSHTHELSINSLRAIFGMRNTYWPNGEAIKVFVLGDKRPVHGKFCKQVLGVFPHQLRRNWDRQIYSGTGQAPVELDSIDDMINSVSTTPGAIGYVPGERLNEQMQEVSIE